MNASELATLRTLCAASAKCFTLSLRDAYNTVPQDDLRSLISQGFWYRLSATQGNLTNSGADALRAANEKARLDADRTAKPLTRIVAHVPDGHCAGGTIVAGPGVEYVDENGTRTALSAAPRFYAVEDRTPEEAGEPTTEVLLLDATTMDAAVTEAQGLAGFTTTKLRVFAVVEERVVSLATEG